MIIPPGVIKTHLLHDKHFVLHTECLVIDSVINVSLSANELFFSTTFEKPEE